MNKAIFRGALEPNANHNDKLERTNPMNGKHPPVDGQEPRTQSSGGMRWILGSTMTLLLTVHLVGFAQEALITPNYKDADIRQIIEAVSEVTGKNFIIDPRVKAQVTMLSATPLSTDAFYEAFLSILQVHGFVAMPSGNVIKIVPDANARQNPATDLPDRVGDASDEIVTQVITVRNVGAAQLVPILRPLIPQYGHLAAHPASNQLIISDRAANVRRMVRIIRRIDQAGDEDIDVIPLTHASAAEVVRVVNALYQQAAGDAGATGIKLVADERTNSVLVSGDTAKRLRLRTLVAHLDTPLETGGDTQVRYLRYADAELLATALKEQLTQTRQQQPAGQAAGTAPAQRGDVIIWADPGTNALIITAAPAVMRSLNAVIDKLDIRRAQVQVETIIAEMLFDKANQLGVTWAVDGSADNNFIGLTNFSRVPFNVLEALSAGQSIAGSGEEVAAANIGVPDGITAGVGRFEDTGTNFAVLLRALAADADTNIISTPSVITMDNEEAEIRVAQEVPFVTGSFVQTGAAAGAVNPFQTIQRQEVGTILKITPQISEGDTVMMKIEQEISALAESSEGAVDLVTNKRTINTNVLVDDGDIVVLGGLIEDQLLEGEQAVPGISKVPGLGWLFRSRETRKIKTNLMVFIRPIILRDRTQTAIVTNDKYNYVRDLQIKVEGEGVQLMPEEERLVLPPLEDQYSGEPPPDAPMGTSTEQETDAGTDDKP